MDSTTSFMTILNKLNIHKNNINAFRERSDVLF
jgi:hypothetical protein